MAYEYENDVVSELEHLGVEYQSNAHYEMADEVEEAYAKAKAFDEILKLEKETSLYSIKGKEDLELGIEIRKIINEYMEDK
ncbi:MAG TPA: hypothetical protein DCO67_03075 [Staphylococcus sp.]|nr:DUF1024 family protein [Mammaliicoccus fleurettii]HAL08933.1 hypothetical protein [Staphylococcus sp.]